MMAKRGRPSGINFDIVKTIKINESQLAKWDPKKIKSFLDGKCNNGQMWEDFKRFYQIIDLYVIGKLNDDQIEGLREQIPKLKEIEGRYTFE